MKAKNYNKKQTERALFVLNKLVPAQHELEAAAEAGADVLEVEARRRAPVRTGNLRDSIQKRLFKSSKTSASYLVYSAAWYADVVEKSPFKNRRPFMRPAFDSKRDEIAKRMGAKLKMRDKVTHY